MDRGTEGQTQINIPPFSSKSGWQKIVWTNFGTSQVMKVVVKFHQTRVCCGSSVPVYVCRYIMPVHACISINVAHVCMLWKYADNIRTNSDCVHHPLPHAHTPILCQVTYLLCITSSWFDNVVAGTRCDNYKTATSNRWSRGRDFEAVQAHTEPGPWAGGDRPMQWVSL